MRSPVLPLLLAAAALHTGASAQQPGPAVTQLQVQARGELAERSCEARVWAPRAPAAPNPDPMEIPAADLVQADEPPGQPAAPLPAAQQVPVKDAQRIAIWATATSPPASSATTCSMRWAARAAPTAGPSNCRP